MRALLLFFVAALAACAPLPRTDPPSAPGQAAAGSAPLTPADKAAAAPRAMVVAANPQAVEAGLAVLRAGGSAVDAAVAVQAVLGLAEPQSSGLGGGAFLLVHDARSGRVDAYDGRETAPAAAGAGLFLDEAGRPLPRGEAILSGRSVGAPGAVAMLGLAHRDHGRRPWASLFAEPVRLAEQGYIVQPRLPAVRSATAAGRTADADQLFTKADGQPVRAGDVHRNPAYAATLRRIAAEGPRALLEGPLAAAIVAKVAEGPRPGALTTADLAAYRPLKTAPLCRPWRVYSVCSAPPPASGVGLLQLLLLLERTDVAERGPADPQGWYLFAEASRLMYADRDRYVGDPAFVSVPVDGLLDPAYIAGRAALIGPRAGPPPSPGTPPGAAARAPDRTLEPAGTSHFVVVDAQGNVASMTTTIEAGFGSGRVVGGFFLNNQLTDFSPPVGAGGQPAANAPGPRKRPRSSMSPAIVLDRRGRFVAAVGSPGGPSIIAYNAKALVGMFDWELPVAEALALPNLVARGGYSAEVDRFDPAVVAGLRARGVDLGAHRDETSGLSAVRRTSRGLEGAADPRRDGAAAGY